jgi:hypothetical protein
MRTSSRDQQLLNLRPELSSAKLMDGTTSIEAFQNQVLRPILKYQNEVLMQIFLVGIHPKNLNIEPISTLEQQTIIKGQFKTNGMLKQLLLGAVIGMFTVKEFEFYNSNKSSLNKRIFSMLKERLLDQWN